jgi:hypothetical protein
MGAVPPLSAPLQFVLVALADLDEPGREALSVDDGPRPVIRRVWHAHYQVDRVSNARVIRHTRENRPRRRCLP